MSELRSQNTSALPQKIWKNSSKTCNKPRSRPVTLTDKKSTTELKCGGTYEFGSWSSHEKQERKNGVEKLEYIAVTDDWSGKMEKWKYRNVEWTKWLTDEHVNFGQTAPKTLYQAEGKRLGNMQSVWRRREGEASRSATLYKAYLLRLWQDLPWALVPLMTSTSHASTECCKRKFTTSNA